MGRSSPTFNPASLAITTEVLAILAVDTESGDNQFRIGSFELLPAALQLFHLLILGMQFPVVGLKFTVAQEEGFHDPLFSIALPPHNPVLNGQLCIPSLIGDKGLLHLPDHRIRQDHGRHPVDVGKIKCQHGKIIHFLDRCGSKDNDVVSAMPSTL